MARNVIYFNSDSNGTLGNIVGLPYTDIIVCFLLPGSVLSLEGDLDVYGDGAALSMVIYKATSRLCKAQAKMFWSHLEET